MRFELMPVVFCEERNAFVPDPTYDYDPFEFDSITIKDLTPRQAEFFNDNRRRKLTVYEQTDPDVFFVEVYRDEHFQMRYM